MAFYFGVGAPVVGPEVYANWLLDSETQGFAFDATVEEGTVSVKDTTTPANNLYNVKLNSSNLVQNGTSPKLVAWNASPYLRWSPHNLCIQSQDLSTSWSNSNTTEAVNATYAPDGNLTADKLIEDAINSNHRIEQNCTFVLGMTYTFSCYFKAAGRTWVKLLTFANRFPANSYGNFDLSNGVVGTLGSGALAQGIESIGNGWYRCWFTSTCSIAGTGQICIEPESADNTGGYTGDGTSGVYVWGAQVCNGTIPNIYLATTTTIRTGIAQQYDSSRSLFGMYNEGASTNLALRSQEFDDATWNKSNATISANATTAPDGTTTADQVTSSSTTDSVAQDVTVVTATIYTWSVFLKASTNTQWVRLVQIDNASTNGVVAWFDILNGVKGTQSLAGSGWTAQGSGIDSIGNGWYRCWSAATTSGTTHRSQIRTSTADGVSTGVSGAVYFAWGAQVETVAYPGTHIPTTSATVTRGQDQILFPFATWSSSASFPITFYTDIKRTRDDRGNQRQFYWSGATPALSIMNCRYAPGANQEQCALQDGSSGAPIGQLSGLEITPVKAINTRYQISAAFATNDSGHSIDGSTELLDNVCVMPTNLTDGAIGNATGAGANALQAYIYRFIIVAARRATATWRYNYV